MLDNFVTASRKFWFAFSSCTQIVHTVSVLRWRCLRLQDLGRGGGGSSGSLRMEVPHYTVMRGAVGEGSSKPKEPPPGSATA